MASDSAFVFRIGVGEPNGANSAILRIWTTRRKSDVYVSFREIVDAAKISLHESGACSSGLTTEAADAEGTLVQSLGGSRHQHRWTRRTHLGSKSAVALHVCFPHSEIVSWRTKPATSNGVRWLSAPAEGRSTIVSCVYTGSLRDDSEWPGKKRGFAFLASTILPNGEKFWLLAEDCPTTPVERHILAEARRRFEGEEPLKFAGEFPGADIGPRLTAFGLNPDIEGYLLVDVARGAAPPTP